MREFLGTGLRFPLGVDAAGRIATSSGEQRVEESIALVLGTRLGERPMLPRFGCAVHHQVFEPNDGTAIGILTMAIRESLALLEARIDVLQIDVRPSPQEPTVMIARIDYRIRANNAVGNLVYPFYIREGS